MEYRLYFQYACRMGFAGISGRISPQDTRARLRAQLIWRRVGAPLHFRLSRQFNAPCAIYFLENDFRASPRRLRWGFPNGPLQALTLGRKCHHFV